MALSAGDKLGHYEVVSLFEALEFAHDRSVIHRDLKRANIKITPECVVKVLDFGTLHLA